MLYCFSLMARICANSDVWWSALPSCYVRWDEVSAILVNGHQGNEWQLWLLRQQWLWILMHGSLCKEDCFVCSFTIFFIAMWSVNELAIVNIIIVFVNCVVDYFFHTVDIPVHCGQIIICTTLFYHLPSVLQRCWLSGRKGKQAVKKWVVGCWHGYLSRARCRFAYGLADAAAHADIRKHSGGIRKS